MTGHQTAHQCVIEYILEKKKKWFLERAGGAGSVGEGRRAGGGRGEGGRAVSQCRTHHCFCGILKERGVTDDIGYETFADELRGGGSPVSVKDSVEGDGVVVASLNLDGIHAQARVLHSSTATHLAVLTAA